MGSLSLLRHSSSSPHPLSLSAPPQPPTTTPLPTLAWTFWIACSLFFKTGGCPASLCGYFLLPFCFLFCIPLALPQLLSPNLNDLFGDFFSNFVGNLSPSLVVSLFFRLLFVFVQSQAMHGLICLSSFPFGSSLWSFFPMFFVLFLKKCFSYHGPSHYPLCLTFSFVCPRWLFFVILVCLDLNVIVSDKLQAFVNTSRFSRTAVLLFHYIQYKANQEVTAAGHNPVKNMFLFFLMRNHCPDKTASCQTFTLSFWAFSSLLRQSNTVALCFD